MGLRLRDIATTQVVALSIEDTIDTALTLMAKADIHHLPVLDDATPVGMVANRDVLMSVGGLYSSDRVLIGAETSHAGPTQVCEVMSRPLFTLDLDDSLITGIQMMLEHRIHAIPLLSHGRIDGMVTARDYLDLFAPHHPCPAPTSANVLSHMMPQVFTRSCADTLADAIRMMETHHVDHVPIVEDDHLVGVVSDRDVREAMGHCAIDAQLRGEAWSDLRTGTRLGMIMSEEVWTLGPDATLSEAAALMIKHEIGMLPVVEGDHMDGLVTENELLAALLTTLDG
jgi:CBS domain-containing protein